MSNSNSIKDSHCRIWFFHDAIFVYHRVCNGNVFLWRTGFASGVSFVHYFRPLLLGVWWCWLTYLCNVPFSSVCPIPTTYARIYLFLDEFIVCLIICYMIVITEFMVMVFHTAMERCISFDISACIYNTSSHGNHRISVLHIPWRCLEKRHCSEDYGTIGIVSWVFFMCCIMLHIKNVHRQYTT